jgi:Chaperone of endosialidase
MSLMSVTSSPSALGGANVSNSCFIGQIYTNIQPSVGTDPDYVTINSSGRRGRANISSRRYKHDVRPIHTASEVIYALKPVSFRYHKEYDASQTIAFGLIAEEVAEVNPDLVGRNPEGQPESVRYEQINAMLLNEFLKEYRKGEEQDRKIQEQETTIAELRSEIRNLAAMVNEQASQLQNVSAQLRITNATAQAIASNPH